MRLSACCLIVLSVLAGVAVVQTPGRAEKRIALVVGNNAYESVPKLENAVNDSTAVARSLRSIGFEVMLATDVSRRELVQQLAEFNGRAQNSDLALLDYAGHGIEGSDSAKESLFNLHDSWRAETKKEVQRLLRGYGFYNGPTQGVFDENTFAALRALAAANPVQERN
jgi:hypothetical protein